MYNIHKNKEKKTNVHYTQRFTVCYIKGEKNATLKRYSLIDNITTQEFYSSTVVQNTNVIVFTKY
jgi:hypothetical protein